MSGIARKLLSKIGCRIVTLNRQQLAPHPVAHCWFIHYSLISVRKSSWDTSVQAAVTSHLPHQVVLARHLHLAAISTWKKIKAGISVNSAAMHHHQLRQDHVRTAHTISMSTLPSKAADIPASFAATNHLRHQVVLVLKAHSKSMNTCSGKGKLKLPTKGK